MTIQEAIQKARETQEPDDDGCVTICNQGLFLYIHHEDDDEFFWRQLKRRKRVQIIQYHLTIHDVLSFTWSTDNISLLTTPILNLDFSVRAINALESVGVETLGRVIQFSRDQLLELKNLGEITADEIEKYVHEKGLCLGAELPPDVLKVVGIPEYLI